MEKAVDSVAKTADKYLCCSYYQNKEKYEKLELKKKAIRLELELERLKRNRLKEKYNELERKYNELEQEGYQKEIIGRYDELLVDGYMQKLAKNEEIIDPDYQEMVDQYLRLKKE